uniref:Uncharacterized protein n=1 Tax=Populus trichocarpa TaxID=3694 RepID=A9PEM8_POPTR|nr:unknown [Populus trichocarpa]
MSSPHQHHVSSACHVSSKRPSPSSAMSASHHQFLSRQQQYFPAFFTEQSKSHLFNFTFMDWICTCCN